MRQKKSRLINITPYLNFRMIFYSLVIFAVLGACDSDHSKNNESDGDGSDNEPPKEKEMNMYQADPTVFSENGTYYLYGTNDENPNEGFEVFTSQDMKTWEGPKVMALSKADNFGSEGFWAPQVWKKGDTYYMAYTANENIAVSMSTDPTGPFTQKKKEPVFETGKHIDPFVFIEDGKNYLFYVDTSNGNKIYMVEMDDDFMSVKKETIKECIGSTTQGWENTQGPSIIEGPAVIKHNGFYYLLYSANDFRNPDYAVGYAVSKDIHGPWKKNDDNPILSSENTNWPGTGGGDTATDKDGNLYYVFHTHNSQDEVTPRKTALVKLAFKSADDDDPDKLVFDGGFRHLYSTP